ncbi:MAG: hypothetical protein MI923_03190 [Phycisphaerales bacterium]|nr:hypothetical protein [Phycisphaerales bacterium]
MRGGFLHNRVLLEPPERFLLERGASVKHEFPTAPGRDAGFVDLFAEYESRRIVVEAELTPARVVNDVAKAVALNANLLLIIVPTRSVAKAANKRLSAIERPEGLTICCEPLGTAMKALRDFCSLMTVSNVPLSLSHKTTRRA